MTSPRGVREKVAAGRAWVLSVIAKEFGVPIERLSPQLRFQVQQALVDAYRQGAFDAHERTTVRPPSERPSKRPSTRPNRRP